MDNTSVDLTAKSLNQCELCCRDFYTVSTKKRFCSAECMMAAKSDPDAVPSAAVGAGVEHVIVGKLLLAGWQVYRSASPCGPVDVIAIREGRTCYLECRKGKRTPSGWLQFSRVVRPGIPRPTEFAVYATDTDEMVIVPIEAEVEV